MATVGRVLCARAGAATARAARASAAVLTTTDFQRIICMCLHRASRNGEARPESRVGPAHCQSAETFRTNTPEQTERGDRPAAGAAPTAGRCYSRYGHERIPPVAGRVRALLRDGARGRPPRDAVRHREHHQRRQPLPATALRLPRRRRGRGRPPVRPGPLRRSGGAGGAARAAAPRRRRLRLPAAAAPRRRRAPVDRGHRPGAARADARHAAGRRAAPRRQRAPEARGGDARPLPAAAAGREDGGARPDDLRRRPRAEQPARPRS